MGRAGSELRAGFWLSGNSPSVTAFSLPGKLGEISMRLWRGDVIWSLGTSKLCLDYQVAYLALFHHVSLLFLMECASSGVCFVPARQISRLETRIKECIRVESIMVKKPRMRNESE